MTAATAAWFKDTEVANMGHFIANILSAVLDLLWPLFGGRSRSEHDDKRPKEGARYDENELHPPKWRNSDK
jgi:hypothetical protein